MESLIRRASPGRPDKICPDSLLGDIPIQSFFRSTEKDITEKELVFLSLEIDKTDGRVRLNCYR
jgi:hypothetical protein